MAKQKERLSMIGIVKLNPTVKFVSDEAMDSLAKKPRTMPSFEGGPVAVIGVKNKSQAVPVPKLRIVR